ncbi:UTP--glucose-1-phosphate uridylyltransferase, partial [Elusimicrobiota bacterium]
DGSPRKLYEAQKLAEEIGIDAVINLEVSDDLVMKRSERRREEAVKKGESVREDDKEGVIDRRLEEFVGETQPAIDYMGKHAMVVNVDVSASAADVNYRGISNSDELLSIFKAKDIALKSIREDMDRQMNTLNLNKPARNLIMELYNDYPKDVKKLLELAIGLREGKGVDLTSTDIVYSLGLIDQLRGAVGSSLELSIDKNFFPSARLTESERQKLMGAVEYADIVKDNSYAAASGEVVLMITNSMDGGIGSSLEREEYLKGVQKRVGDITRETLGSKSTDLFFWVERDGKKESISIAEAKLLNSIEMARQGKVKGVVVQSLVSSVTKEAFEELLERVSLEDRLAGKDRKTGRSYRELVDELEGIESTDMLVQGALPTIDVEKDELTTDRLAPGGHGQWGVKFLLDALNGELPVDLPNDGKSLISAIYNGDGINNSPDATMLGWMHRERVPMVMVTTTKTGLDRKGGQLGIVRQDGKEWIDIMEKAQADSAGQGELFIDMGLTEGEAGEQYFNTNMLFFNWSVLVPFLLELKDIIGEKEFNRVISPTLIKNKKSQDGRDFVQLEGAIGSVVLSLNAYLVTTENKEIQASMKKHGIDQMVRILNVGEKDRTGFFTPVKNAFDFWLQFYSDLFEMDTENWELKSNRPGHLPSVTLNDGYYNKAGNVLEAFEGVSVIGMDSLKIEGKVILKGAVLKGDVQIISAYDGVVDLSDLLGDEKTLENVIVRISDDKKLIIEAEEKEVIERVAEKTAKEEKPGLVSQTVKKVTGPALESALETVTGDPVSQTAGKLTADILKPGEIVKEGA